MKTTVLTSVFPLSYILRAGTQLAFASDLRPKQRKRATTLFYAIRFREEILSKTDSRDTRGA